MFTIAGVGCNPAGHVYVALQEQFPNMSEVSTPPVQLAAWLACAAFSIWFLLLVDKGIQRMRGEPPASELDAAQNELKRRVKALEEWRAEIIAKLDADKRELLEAGEKREAKLSAEIKTASDRIDGMQKTISEIPGEFMSLLSNARNVLREKEF